jgi:uncharacterized protein YkwD
LCLFFDDYQRYIHLTHHTTLNAMFRSIIILSLSALALSIPLNSPLTRRAPTPEQQQEYLDAHNSIRAQHNAVPLAWNQTLSDAAASWAARCVFEHSGGKLGPFGENLAAGTNETPEGAVKSWTDEISASPSRFPSSVRTCC